MVRALDGVRFQAARGGRNSLLPRVRGSEACARRGAVLALLCATALTTAPTAAAVAAPRRPDAALRFDIPAQPLSQALNQLALRSDREILFSPALTQGKRSEGLSGVFTAEAALHQLLAGSGLTVQLEGRSFLVVPAARPARTSTTTNAPPPAPPPQQPVAIDSVVVTALKRSSLAGQTPISMTVISGEQLSRAGIVDLDKAAPLLPGLKLISTAFGRRLVLRGVYGAGEATTGLYYDETPMTGPVGTTADPGVMAPELALVDVDRVELLRGPQGTLYGSGAMGGALRILFKRPDLSADSASVGASLSSAAHGGQGGGANAALNLVAIPETLALRLTAYDQRQPGVIDNVRLGLKDVDASRVRGVRLAALWAPGSRLSALVSATHQASRRDDISAWNDTAGPLADGPRRPARPSTGTSIWRLATVVKWRGDTVDHYRCLVLVSLEDWCGDPTIAASCSASGRTSAGCAADVLDRWPRLATATQMASYSAYVDSVYPAILNQPAELTAQIHEIGPRRSARGR